MSLEVGQTAPEFESKDQDGNPIKLSDFRGKKLFYTFIPKTTPLDAQPRPVT